MSLSTHSEILVAQQLYEQIDKEYDLPIEDKTLSSLMMFQFNFEDLKKVLEFLLQNQKKQQFVISQLLENQNHHGIAGTPVKIIERIVEPKKADGPNTESSPHKSENSVPASPVKL